MGRNKRKEEKARIRAETAPMGRRAASIVSFHLSHHTATRCIRHTAGVMIGLDHRDPQTDAESTPKDPMLSSHLLDPAAD